MGGITLEHNKLEMTKDMDLLETTEAEIDLLDFFQYLLRRVKYVILAAFLGIVVTISFICTFPIP